MNSVDLADLAILGLANEKGQFTIQLGMSLDQDEQDAFERGIDYEWFTLVDVRSAKAARGLSRVMRVFRLTPYGRRRLAILKLRAEVPV